MKVRGATDAVARDALIRLRYPSDTGSARLRRLAPIHKRREPGDRVLLQTGHGVLVEELGDDRVPVPEDPAHDLRRDAGLQAQGGERVPEVVEADQGQPSPNGQSPERMRDDIGVQGSPVGAAEDQSLVLVGLAGCLALFELSTVMLLQHSDRLRIERHGPPAAIVSTFAITPSGTFT